MPVSGLAEKAWRLKADKLALQDRIGLLEVDCGRLRVELQGLKDEQRVGERLKTLCADRLRMEVAAVAAYVANPQKQGLRAELIKLGLLREERTSAPFAAPPRGGVRFAKGDDRQRADKIEDVGAPVEQLRPTKTRQATAFVPVDHPEPEEDRANPPGRAICFRSLDSVLEIPGNDACVEDVPAKTVRKRVPTAFSPPARPKGGVGFDDDVEEVDADGRESGSASEKRSARTRQATAFVPQRMGPPHEGGVGFANDVEEVDAEEDEEGDAEKKRSSRTRQATAFVPPKKDVAHEGGVGFANDVEEVDAEEDEEGAAEDKRSSRTRQATAFVPQTKGAPHEGGVCFADDVQEVDAEEDEEVAASSRRSSRTRQATAFVRQKKVPAHEGSVGFADDVEEVDAEEDEGGAASATRSSRTRQATSFVPRKSAPSHEGSVSFADDADEVDADEDEDEGAASQKRSARSRQATAFAPRQKSPSHGGVRFAEEGAGD